ncbi:hypothetical protein [Thiolapillus sp.]
MIRPLLGLLVAGNVVLFLWIQYGDSGRNTGQQQMHKPDFGEIRLLREVKEPKSPELEPPLSPEPDQEVVASVPQQQLPSAPEQALVAPESEPESEPEPAAATVYCGELGPIRSRNMAKGYEQALSRSEVARVQVEARPGQEITGYWAMIPALPDVASAEAMLKKLQAAGLEDLWLIRNGELENAISLGLYTEERYAKRHADNVREMGFEPVVTPKKKKARMYWVVFSGVDETVLKEFGEEKLPANAVLQKKVCKQALPDN